MVMRHSDAVENIVTQFEEISYEVFIHFLNASNYGILQDRTRAS